MTNGISHEDAALTLFAWPWQPGNAPAFRLTRELEHRGFVDHGHSPDGCRFKLIIRDLNRFSNADFCWSPSARSQQPWRSGCAACRDRPEGAGSPRYLRPWDIRRTMTAYFLKLAGPERDRVCIDAEDISGARNAAVQYLGQYLSDHPGFADEGHWQLNVENASGQSLLHIIVATVVPRGAPDDASLLSHGDDLP